MLAGDIVTLECSTTLPNGVSGTPDFEWIGPGEVPSAANIIISNKVVSSSVILSSIATSQAGEYNCTATLHGSFTKSLPVHVKSKFFFLGLVLFKPRFYHLSSSPYSISSNRFYSPTYCWISSIFVL